MPTQHSPLHGTYTHEHGRVSNKILFIYSYKTIHIEHVYSVRPMECEHRECMTNNGTTSMTAYHLETAESTVGLRLRLGLTGLDDSVVPTLVGPLATGVIRALAGLRVASQHRRGCIYAHGTVPHGDKKLMLTNCHAYTSATSVLYTSEV